jgi:hypothetical protein
MKDYKKLDKSENYDHETVNKLVLYVKWLAVPTPSSSSQH